MNSILLTRLFRAIETNDSESLLKIASAVVEEEKKKGHKKLSLQLEKIIADAQNRLTTKYYVNPEVSEKKLFELPKSQRNNQPLATFIPAHVLRHYMVLQSDVEDRFERIEKEFAARDRLARHNLKPRKKILLYGPPGCGKTMGAERLAWNVGLPLLKVRFDSLISSYFGETSANLRSIFDASQKSPCVLLLDECDIIAKSRTSSSDVGETQRIVNMLLMLLDEYESAGLLVATTNLEGSLDKAIYRRFDDIIEIKRPDSQQIEQLLKTTLAALNINKKINWGVLFKKVKGLSAADVVSVAQNAAKTAILDGSSTVNDTHLTIALDEIAPPSTKKINGNTTTTKSSSHSDGAQR